MEFKKLSFFNIGFIFQALITILGVVFLFIGLVQNAADEPLLQATRIVFLVAFFANLFYAVYGYKLFGGSLLKYLFVINGIAIGLQTVFFCYLGVPLGQAIIMLLAAVTNVYIAGRFTKSRKEVYILLAVEALLLLAYFIYAVFTSHKLYPQSGFEAVRRIFEILVPCFMFGSCALAFISRESTIRAARSEQK